MKYVVTLNGNDYEVEVNELNEAVVTAVVPSAAPVVVAAPVATVAAPVAAAPVAAPAVEAAPAPAPQAAYFPPKNRCRITEKRRSLLGKQTYRSAQYCSNSLR